MKDDFFFHVKRRRPEEIFDNVTDYYNLEMITKYAKSKSMMNIQEKITIRALELLDLTKPKLRILDAGCGPGFAAMYLKEIGYETVSLDIIADFLKCYNISDLNPLVADMCFPPFKHNSFDAIISISALQWIYKDINKKRMDLSLIALAKSFYIILKPKCKAIFQFYPKNSDIMEAIGKIFINNTAFKGNFVIDNPNSPKRRKIFLVLKKEL